MKFTEAQIEQMRYELENPEAMAKRIEQDIWIDKFIRISYKFLIIF